MAFTEAEKGVFEHLGRKYDPLAVQAALVRATKGTLDAAVAAYNAQFPADPSTGDVDAAKRGPTPEQLTQGAVAHDVLAAAARVAFKLPPFPEKVGDGDAAVIATDAVALDHLFGLFEYLEGKG